MNSISKIKTPFKRDLLIISLPDGRTRRYTLRSENITFGRADTNDLTIKHESVSRQHGRLRRKGEALLVEDLESVNGTWVADKPIPPHTPVQIPVGQFFWAGKVEVRFQHQDFLLPILTIISAIIFIAVVIIMLPKPAHSKPNPFVCDSPSLLIIQPDPNLHAVKAAQRPPPTDTAEVEAPTVPIPEGTQTQTLAATPTTAVEEPSVYNALAFLDLPFPYTSDKSQCVFGTQEEFQLASQRNGMGGRVNSFFDHFLPIYPYDPAHPDRSEAGGREGPEPPEAKNVLLFTGELSPYDSYSGHPGYDYSTNGYGDLYTPVCAAADGIIADAGGSKQEGIYVKINHSVDDNGEVIKFQTFYLHLQEDEYFEQIKAKKGLPISIHDRIGTMGNTGHSTGAHLHFEVRRDINNDGALGQREVVDPYGYFPSQEEYATDRWPLPNDYLWIYPLAAEATIPVSGSKNQGSNSGKGGLSSEGLIRPAQLCAPANTLPPGGKLSFAVSLSPPPAQGLRSIGRATVISVKNINGEFVNQFDQPIRIMIPFLAAELDYVKNNDKLRIYRLESQQQGNKMVSVWRPLTTNLDTDNGIAVASTDSSGQFALLGEPTRDTFPPRVEILTSGPQTSEGTYYDTVTVTLIATDEQHGISQISWSLDGRAWNSTPLTENPVSLELTATFTIPPDGVPVPQSEIEGDIYIGGPGRFQIMAYAIDSEGNTGEFTPVIEHLVIDPSKNPDQ